MTCTTRFDLEQQLLAVWTTIDDLKYIKQMMDSDNIEEASGLITGLQLLMNAKMETAFNMVEELVSTGVIK